MGAAIILNSLKLIFKWRFGCVGFYWSFTFLKMQICRVLTVHQNVLISILLTKIFIQKCLAELDIYTDIDTDVSRIIASSGVAMQSLLINSGLGVFIYFGWKANGIITFWAFWLELSFEVILSSQLVQTVWKFFTTCSISSSICSICSISSLPSRENNNWKPHCKQWTSIFQLVSIADYGKTLINIIQPALFQ